MNIKGKLAATALAFGLYHLAAPEMRELDDNKSYAPNAIQQEFMKLAAQKYDYLALGDTDHRRVESRLFALSQETVKAVSDGGDKNYFIEHGPSSQKYFDALRRGTIRTYNYSHRNIWICSDKVGDRLNKAFSNTAYNKDVRFVAADRRRMVGSRQRNAGVTEVFTATAYALYVAIYGCFGDPAYTLLMTIRDFAELSTGGVDDRLTADLLLSYKNGGTLFYGAGHLEDRDKEENGKYSMKKILKRSGKSLSVLNVYSDIKHKESSPYHFKHADAYLYVTPSVDQPDGVYINNKAELQELYEQAIKNVRQRGNVLKLQTPSV